MYISDTSDTAVESSSQTNLPPDVAENFLLRVTRHAPLGDPTEIEVRDFHLSLRKDEADALIVTPVTGGES